MKIKNLSLVALAALALASCGNNAPAPVEAEPVKIEPGEQAPLADPGQKNFGGMATPATPPAWPSACAGCGKR